jgi:LPXTG-motif cell wall-anchored protein
MREITTAIVTAVFLLPATALGAEPVQGAVPPATEVAPAAAAPPVAEPAPATTETEAQPTPRPAAQPAQNPDDVAGGNEYSEEAPPTGTGEPDTPETPTTDDDAPTQSAPSTGTAPSATGTTAAEVSDPAATDGLPRTGSDGWILGLIGIALLGSGLLLRRAAVQLR